MVRVLFFTTIIFFLASCGGSAPKQKFVPLPPPPLSATAADRDVVVHQMRGAYPSSYIGKQLGDGLFNPEFFVAVQLIRKKRAAGSYSQPAFGVIAKTNDKTLDKIENEARSFFSSEKSLDLVEGNRMPDVRLILSYGKDKDEIIFTLNYPSSGVFAGNLDERVATRSLEERVRNANKTWSKVTVEANSRSSVPELYYEIMQNSVTVGELFDKGSETESATGVRLNQADAWCFSKYGGSIASIYAFEYALREGAINAPYTPAHREIVAGFDSDEESEDNMLFRRGDIVRSESKITEEEKVGANGKPIAYTEVVVFDHHKKKYEFNQDSFSANDAGFRCMRKVSQ